MTERSGDRASHPTLKVLYIVGFARSGTTILGNLLGGIDEFFHMGEVFHLWRRIVRSKGNCGCRNPVQECEFWSRVLSTTFSGEAHPGDEGARLDGRFYARAWEVQKKAMARTTWRRLVRAGSGKDLGNGAYASLMERLLQNVAAVSGAHVLVDSSKLTKPGALLRSMPSIVPYFLHVVRDPRGAVLSRQRRHAPMDGGRIVLKRTTATADSVRWVRRNIEAEWIGRSASAGRYMRVGYETFAKSPQATLDSIADWVHGEPVRLPMKDRRTAWIGTNHTVCGNHSRFQTGEVRLSLDDRWVEALRAQDFLLITSLTAPMLARYGYPLRRPCEPGVSEPARRLESVER